MYVAVAGAGSSMKRAEREEVEEEECNTSAKKRGWM